MPAKLELVSVNSSTKAVFHDKIATNNGGGGGGDDMLQRIKDLEGKVSTLTTDVAIIKDKLATKEDIQSVKTELHKELGSQTWKIITALVITVAVAVFSKYFIK